jgi:hypothetical protein
MIWATASAAPIQNFAAGTNAATLPLVCAQKTGQLVAVRRPSVVANAAQQGQKPPRLAANRKMASVPHIVPKSETTLA